MYKEDLVLACVLLSLTTMFPLWGWGYLEDNEMAAWLFTTLFSLPLGFFAVNQYEKWKK